MSDTPTHSEPPRKPELFEVFRNPILKELEYDALMTAVAGMLPSDESLEQNPTAALSVARGKAQKVVEDKVVNATATGSLSLQDACALSLALEQSTTALAGYATYNDKHAEVIARTLADIERYLTDASLERPLNFLLTASPGAGKSHFVNCITKALKERKHKIKSTDFNMASMSGRDDLIAPLDAARTSHIDGEVPLLFLDEFDASPDNYGLLLPLLWDGAISVGRRDLKLGRVVIIMAGSSPALPKMVNRAKRMKRGVGRKLPEGGHPKMIDLFSRVSGSVIRIPPFGDPGGKHPERKADKVAVAVALLSKRFKKLEVVPLGLLRLVARLRFRYDVRSIAHLMDCIRPTDEQPAAKRTRLTMGDLNLPLTTTDELTESSLAYHILSGDNGEDVVAEWKECENFDAAVPIKLKKQHSGPADEVHARVFAIDKLWKTAPTHEHEHAL